MALFRQLQPMIMLASVTLLVQASIVFAQSALLPTCPAPHCTTNPCRQTGRDCCNCKQIPFASNTQVCSCCPAGYSCCQPNSLDPWCCPTGTTCGIKRECILSATVAPVPSDTTCSPCDKMMLSITCDDAIDAVYLDGVLTMGPQTTSWQSVHTIQIPADTQLVAVKCRDTRKVRAGILLSTNNNYIVTNTAWKCTTQFYNNWMQISFPDGPWPAAFISDVYPGGVHSIPLPPISNAAEWIWTSNFQGSNIDSTVYCRYHVPSNGCNQVYGNCTNLCANQHKTCCHCQMFEPGPTKVCSCCPQSYHCCPTTTIGGPYVCCPKGYNCASSTVTHKPICVRNQEPPYSPRSTLPQSICGPCNQTRLSTAAADTLSPQSINIY